MGYLIALTRDNLHELEAIEGLASMLGADRFRALALQLAHEYPVKIEEAYQSIPRQQHSSVIGMSDLPFEARRVACEVVISRVPELRRLVEPRYHLLRRCDEQKEKPRHSPFSENAFHVLTVVESDMSLLWRCIEFVWRDKRLGREQARDRAFIAALNNLQSLRVTPDGGMSIDPDEIREQVIASRQSLKRFLRQP